MNNIALINASTVITDIDAQIALTALQLQVTNDFCPHWGIDAKLHFYKHGDAIPSGYWQLAILDNADQAGALGYHDLTTEGLPLGKIFAGTDKQYGYSWTVTASHELLEMLADPTINLTVFKQTRNAAGTLYAYEVADACEDDQFGYTINGTLVSDFVLPSWFQAFTHPAGTKFDFKGHIAKQFQLLTGGYIGIFKVTNGSGWTQLTHADGWKYRSLPMPGSRRERRNRSDWKLSEHKPIV